MLVHRPAQDGRSVGATPLHLAATYCGNSTVVFQALLQLGAQNRRDDVRRLAPPARSRARAVIMAVTHSLIRVLVLSAATLRWMLQCGIGKLRFLTLSHGCDRARACSPLLS